MEFGIPKVAAGTPEAPPEALTTAPEALTTTPEALTTAPKMVSKRAMVKEPGIALLSLWALSFRPWLFFAGDGPLT